MPRWLIGALLVLVVIPAAAALLAQTDPLDEVQAGVASGDRRGARETLDSLLAEPGALGGTALSEAEFLRTLLEEDGSEYEQRLRRLLEQELAPAREAWVHLALGQLAFQRGDLAFALKEFQRVQELGKHDEGALWEGLTASALGDAETARRALESVKDASRPAIRDRALLVLGDTYRAGGEWSEARSRYRQIREQGAEGSPWWPAATWREAECLLELEDVDEAKNLMRELISEVPAAYETPLARERLAALSEGEGEEAPAEAASGESGFAVQVGAFSSQANAKTLAGDLRGRGLDGVRVISGEDGLFRVLLGRFPGREEAESYGDSLSAALGLGFSIVKEK